MFEEVQSQPSHKLRRNILRLKGKFLVPEQLQLTIDVNSLHVLGLVHISEVYPFF